MLTRDCTIIISILAVLWLILCFVMIQVSDIVSGHAVRIGILATGLLVAAFATASSTAVLIHLRKNRRELYKKELFQGKSAAEPIEF